MQRRGPFFLTRMAQCLQDHHGWFSLANSPAAQVQQPPLCALHRTDECISCLPLPEYVPLLFPPCLAGLAQITPISSRLSKARQPTLPTCRLFLKIHLDLLHGVCIGSSWPVVPVSPSLPLSLHSCIGAPFGGHLLRPDGPPSSDQCRRSLSDSCSESKHLT